MMPSDTPVAFFTNAAYLIAGLLIIRGIPVRVKRVPSWAWAVGLTFIALAIGSGLHHWFNQTNAPPVAEWAQLADERGMYVCFSLLAGWSFRKTLGDWLLYPAALMGAGLATFAHLPALDSMWMMPALALLILLGISLEDGFKRAGFFLLGFVAIELIRELPELNFWQADPLFLGLYDWIHGLWHLGTCIFMVAAWLSPFIESKRSA